MHSLDTDMRRTLATAKSAERRLLSLAVSAHELTPAERRCLFDQWAVNRQPRETLVGYLFRIGWLRPDAVRWLNHPPAKLEGVELFSSRMFDRVTAEVGGVVGD